MNYLLQESTQFRVWSQMESQDRGEVGWDPWNLVSNPKSPPNIALIQSAAYRMHPCATRIQTYITEQIKGKIHRNDLELYHRCNMQSTEQNKTSPWRNASRVCTGAVKSNIITLIFFSSWLVHHCLSTKPQDSNREIPVVQYCPDGFMGRDEARRPGSSTVSDLGWFKMVRSIFSHLFMFWFRLFSLNSHTL